MTRLQFNNTVLQLSRKLYLIAFRFLKNKEEAEDAVQEVFIKLWNRKDNLEKYASIEALATTTIKNHCIDQLRKVRMMGIDDLGPEIPYFINEPTPYEQLERDETSKILHSVIESLPEGYREVIWKREIEGLSYEDIASQTNQNINTLRVALSRARGMIRDELKKQKYENTGNRKVAGKVL